jgi:hypothetical protein
MKDEQANDPRLEKLVETLDNLLRQNGMGRLFAAFALLTRRIAEHWLKANSLQNHDEWMGLYSRLRFLYESKVIPASWPRPKFRWY